MDEVLAVGVEHVVHGRLFLGGFGVDPLHAVVRTARHVEGVVHQKPAARRVDVAADGHQVDGGQVQGHGAHVLVERKAPLDGRAVARSEQAGRPDDVFHRDLADLGGAFRGPLLHMLGNDVEAGGPLFHELVVVQVFVDDDVQPGAGQRRVGAGTDGQPVFRASAPPGQTRVNGDDLGAHLHALHQPVANVAVGVGGQRLVAPHH